MRSALIAIVSLPSFALGQPQGEGTWIWEVETQDGDAIVEPGETATVSLWLDMDPSVGEHLPDGFKVGGFASGVVSVIGGGNADKGQVLGWELNPILNEFGLEGTTDGVSIFDVQLVQFPKGADLSDPIFLMSYEWGPLEFAPYEATYSLLIQDWVDDLPGFRIWKIDGDELITEHWTVVPSEVTISVVPAPGALAPLALSIPCVSRRNRRMDDAPLRTMDRRDSDHSVSDGTRTSPGTS